MTEPLTETELRELREKAEMATPGPWVHRYENATHGIFFGNRREQNIALSIHGRGNGGMEEEQSNAAFIAAANPATVLRLLDTIEARDRAVEVLMANRCRCIEDVKAIAEAGRLLSGEGKT